MSFIKKFPVRKTVILAFVSALTIFILFKTLINLDDFSRVIKNINRTYFFLAFATLIPALMLSVVRWYLVLRSAGFSVSFWKIFKIIASSMSLSVIPGRLGDLARSYPLRNKIPVTQSVGTIIIEKIIDISVLMFFSAVGLALLGYFKISILVFMLSMGSFPALGVLNTLSRKVKFDHNLLTKLQNAISILSQIRQKKILLSAAILASAANWTLSMFQAYWLFKAVGSVIPLSAIYTFYPLSIFVGLIPITLAGAGTRDSAIIYFFSNFAAPEQSLAVGILYGLQSYWITSLIGLPLLYYFFKQND